MRNNVVWYRRGKLAQGWIMGNGYPPGVQFDLLGDALLVNGTSWTPVLCDGDEDPYFCRTDGIEVLRAIQRKPARRT